MSMPRCATFTHDDPIPYQAAIRGGQIELAVTAKGGFRGNLIRIDLHKLWLQHGSENRPRVIHAVLNKQRVGFAFNSDPSGSAPHYSGMQLGPNAIFVIGPGSSVHSRTVEPHSWAAMSLALEDLPVAYGALVGRELTRGPAVRLVHANPAHMVRLVRLHAAARRLAVTAPETLTHPEVSVAMENELVHALVSCLADEVPAKAGSGWRYHTAIIDRFEEVLAANCDRPMYLADICAAVGASERTLRASCEEHLGMGPIRYLWVRRMHLARRALLVADPAKATVTQIATDYGFWELGRFSVSYQALFGEAPSATLRKSSSNRKAVQARPFSFADSDFA